MEFESTLHVVSNSFDDVQEVFNLLISKYSRLTARVWRCVPSFDEMDNSYVQMEIDRILFWTPEDLECEKTMMKIASILGQDGFALLVIRNSVSPDYCDFKVTTPDGACNSAFDQEDYRSVMRNLEGSYSDDLIKIYHKSKDGYKELWDKDRHAEPPMPYKRESKPVRTHEQVLQDDYLYRKSDESVAAFQSLLANKKDLSSVYDAFRKQFEVLKSDPETLDKQDLCIVTNYNSPRDTGLYEKASLATRLERAEQFSFRGKIFHIHGNSAVIEFYSLKIDPKLLELVCQYEDDLRIAIARRGGIIDDYDYDKNRLRYTDCCVMIDNEDQRYWNWTDKFSNAINDYGMELITRFAVWYAITRTPELSEEELEKLGKSSFYLDAIESKNTKVLERDKALKAEADERGRQYKLQEEKDFGEIMKLLKEKYSTDKASSCAQIEDEVELRSFKALSYWTSVKNYIKEHYHMTAAAYFKQEGLTGKKETARKVPEKKVSLPKAEPAAKKAPAKKAEKENPLISFMRSDHDSQGLNLDDLLDSADDFSLDDLDLDDFDLEDEEEDEDIQEFIKEVEDIVEKLTKKYKGKPRFASFVALKKENPDIDWEDVEGTIKDFIHSTPAAYFKEAGLVRSGQAKEQIIGKAEEKPIENMKSATDKKTPGKKAEPTTKTAPGKKAEPATKKTLEKKTEPTTKKTPEKKTEPATKTAPEKKTEPATKKTPEKKTEPATKTAPEKKTETTIKKAPEKKTEPVTKPAAKPVPESAQKPDPQPVEKIVTVDSPSTNPKAFQKAGNHVFFGRYAQTEDVTEETPIEWVVLDYHAADHKALLLSLYGLIAKPYHKRLEDVTWEKSDLRKWLNSQFFRIAFSDEEQAAILTISVDNSPGQGVWVTPGGNNTSDKIFLLSYREARAYSAVVGPGTIAGKDSVAKTKPTVYAEKTGAYKSFLEPVPENNNMGRWWLRSPGDIPRNATYVNTDGTISAFPVNVKYFCVRPALWVDLRTDNQRTTKPIQHAEPAAGDPKSGERIRKEEEARKQAEREKREAEVRRKAEERIRQERIAWEKAEAERKQEEHRKEAARNDLRKEIRLLEEQRDKIKGILGIIKKKAIQKKIDELTGKLRQI